MAGRRPLAVCVMLATVLGWLLVLAMNSSAWM